MKTVCTTLCGFGKLQRRQSVHRRTTSLFINAKKTYYVRNDENMTFFCVL